MSEYTTVSGIKGVRYQKDKRFIAKAAVPPKILAKLETSPVVSDVRVHVPPPTKICLYCKEPAKLSRVITLETVYLCDNDYYSKTTGQIVQRLREYNDEENSQVSED